LRFIFKNEQQRVAVGPGNAHHFCSPGVVRRSLRRGMCGLRGPRGHAFTPPPPLLLCTGMGNLMIKNYY